MTSTLDPVLELPANGAPQAARVYRRPTVRWAWLAVVATIAVVVWASGIGRHAIVNPGGWPLLRRFWAAAFAPDLSSAALRQTVRAVRTTVAYAVLGTAVGVAFGAVGALGSSSRAMRRRLLDEQTPARSRLVRLLLVVPRGIHEAVWALLLLSVLGRDPVVAILAIAIPYGAISAKVFADIIDDAAQAAHRQVRCLGARRLGSLLYAVVPDCSGDLVSYGFYRFECALRSAIVLGMVGVGGIGFELSQSFQGLDYRRMWTSLYTLLALGVVAEGLGANVRHAAGRARTGRRTLGSVAMFAGVVAGVLAWLELRPGVSVLFGARTRQRVGRLAGESWPPRLPRGGWFGLLESAAATAHVSLLALLFATTLAVPMAVIASRTRRRRSATQLAAKVVRAVALVLRSIPAPVWALLALFVLIPGVVPGAVALGIYTAGVLARLFGEAIENMDRTGEERLVASGTGRVAGFAYATMPGLTARWTTFALYRWEVAARDAAVVGAVGTAGLGRVLTEQTAAFDFRRLLTTVTALIVVTAVVDTVSNRARQVLR